MARITVLRNFPPLTDLDLMVRDDWAAVGRLARERIIRRTQSGLDEAERPFRPYSAAYARAKQKAGASPRVDLTLSGAMLNAITVEPDDDGVTLSFTH